MDAFILLYPLVTELVSAWERVWCCLGAVAGQEDELFVENHSEKVWLLVLRTGESPRKVLVASFLADQGGGALQDEFIPTLMSSWMERSFQFVIVLPLLLPFKIKSSWVFHCGSCCPGGLGHKTNLAC